jgi:hypothetical protein
MSLRTSNNPVAPSIAPLSSLSCVGGMYWVVDRGQPP